MNPITSSETIQLIHDTMIREQLQRQRVTGLGHTTSLRRSAARLLVALGARLDPSARPASTVVTAPFRKAERPIPLHRLGAAPSLEGKP
jgi:hypothetical protein